MTAHVVLVPGAIGAGLLFLWFLRLERDDRPEVIFGVILAVYIVEMLLYQSQTDVPRGLARIDVAGGSFRPPEILLPMALAARLIVKGFPRKVNTVGLLWGAFLTWYGAEAVIGVLAGNPKTTVIYQAKCIVTIACAALFVSGIDLRRLVDRGLLGRWIAVVGSASVLLLGMSVLGKTLDLPIPGLPVPELGDIGADTRFIVPVIALAILLVEVCRVDRRPWVCLLCLGTMALPLAGTQAAAYVGVGAAVAVVAVAALGRTWRRRVFFTGTEALLLAALIGGVFIGATVISRHPPVDVSKEIQTSFFAESSDRTTRARFRLWHDALHLVHEKPVMGWGLGVQQVLKEEFDPTKELESTPHNIALDISVRSGLIGLALLAAAFAWTVVAAVRAWRQHVDRYVAALALAALAALAAFLATAWVESAFDRFRNVTLLGIAIGVVVAAVRTLDTAEELPVDQPPARSPIASR